MKVKELKILFCHEIDKIKENKQPTTQFILNAYNKVLKSINETLLDNETVTHKKIMDLPITEHMKEKLQTFSKKKIPKYLLKTHANDILSVELDRLLGIGDKKAKELLKLGLTNINELRQEKWFNLLNKDTQLMITHKPLRKIPHEKISKIEKKLIGFSKNNSVVSLVGSYRRNKPFSRDIDILLRAISEDYMNDYVAYLKQKFNNRVYLYSKGSDRISLIIQHSLKSEKYKLDIFRSSPETYYSNLLYSTGSKEFNIRMRSKARRMGYLLNQNGIFKDGARINNTDDTEHELFKILDMRYEEPKNRF